MAPPVTIKKQMSYSENVNEAEKVAIRRIVYSFNTKGILPSGKQVLQVVNEDDKLPNFKRVAFYRILRSLKFRHNKQGGRNVLIDASKVVLSRRRYLDKIRQYREENRPIYYLDEMWINAEYTVPETMVNMNTEQKPMALTKDARKLILLHIGNEKGFVHGAEEIVEWTKSKKLMEAEHFEQLLEKILTKLGGKAVVVMDTASHHARKTEKLPNSMWPKVEIQNWLKSKDIAFEEDELRAELLMRVENVKEKYTKYVVDDIAKKYNVEVLRLPPFHFDLNPMVVIWDEVKGYVKKNSFFTFEDGKNVFKAAIDNVTSGQWQLAVDSVKKIEDYYYNIDDVIDEATDNLDSDAESTDIDSETDSSDDNDAEYTDIDSETDSSDED